MKVIRKQTTAGGTEAFIFDVSSSVFLVKNMTASPVTVEILDGVVTIPGNTAQVIMTRINPTTSDITDTVTVTALETSDLGVEVQCLDY